jgi:hypothetical protein
MWVFGNYDTEVREGALWMFRNGENKKFSVQRTEIHPMLAYRNCDTYGCPQGMFFILQ